MVVPKSNIIFVLCTHILCEIWPRANAGDVYSAITDLPPLLYSYKLVIGDLDGYIQEEERRIHALKKKLVLLQREHAIAMEDIPSYLVNPINAITLIKRLTMDLTKIEKNANLTTAEFIKNVTDHKSEAPFPDTEDLLGAVSGLSRLQETYQLHADELAEGKINGVTYSLPMTADDCFDIGEVLFKNSHHKFSIEWMLKALQMYEERNETDLFSFKPVDVMYSVSLSYYELGDIKNSMKFLENVPDSFHHAIDVQTHKRILRMKITEGEKTIEGQSQPVKEEYKKSFSIREYIEDLVYMAHCRGEYEPVTEITKRLTCFYLTKNHPFLRLAPFKAEQLYIDPNIFIFYDVISDEESSYLKGLAKPKISRAQVYDPDRGRFVSEERVGKNTFVEGNDVINRISLRVADFTGLSMEFSEDLHIVNYGIGGHYDLHYDHANIEAYGHNLLTSVEGNRIATVLFYLTDVPLGGATVFTELGLSVFPVKNAALFWMNLHPSGEGDDATMHGGCPVLVGSKWVATKWIRLNDQVFHRPCSLEYQTEGFLRKKRPKRIHKVLT